MQPDAEQVAEGDSHLEGQDMETPGNRLSSEEELLSFGKHCDGNALIKQPLHRINEPPHTQPPTGAVSSPMKTEGDFQGSGPIARRSLFKGDLLANSLRRAVRFIEPNHQRRKLRLSEDTNTDTSISEESVPMSDPKMHKEAWTVSQTRIPTRQALLSAPSAKDIQTWVRSATQSIHNNLGRSHSRFAKGAAAGIDKETVPKSQFFTWEMLNKVASTRKFRRKNACARLWLPGNGDTVDWSGAGFESEDHDDTNKPTSNFSPNAQNKSRGEALHLEWSQLQCFA